MTSDGRYIVFQSNRSGGTEIWRADLDGGDLRQLTTAGGGSHPDVTPDGKWVLYVASDNEISSIWKVSIDGGTPRRVTDKVSDWPRVSPNGRLLACAYVDKSVSAHTQLAVLSLEDGKLLHHFDLPRSATFNNGVHWSPDGSAVNYRHFGAGLWRQPLTGSALAKWPDLPNKRTHFFDWSNDGRQFAISYDDEVRDAVLITNFH